MCIQIFVACGYKVALSRYLESGLARRAESCPNQNKTIRNVSEESPIVYLVCGLYSRLTLGQVYSEVLLVVHRDETGRLGRYCASFTCFIQTCKRRCSFAKANYISSKLEGQNVTIRVKCLEFHNLGYIGFKVLDSLFDDNGRP